MQERTSGGRGLSQRRQEMSTSTFFTQEGTRTHGQVPFIDISLYIFMHLSICSTLSVESKCHDKPFVTAATTLSYRRQLPDRKTSTMMKTKSRGTTEWCSWGNVLSFARCGWGHDVGKSAWSSHERSANQPECQKVKQCNVLDVLPRLGDDEFWIVRSVGLWTEKPPVEQRNFAVLHQMRYRPVALRSIDYSTHW